MASGELPPCVQADGIVADGLVQAGYQLLAVTACPSLMHPSNRAVIASYAFSRGLTLVFTGLESEALRPRILDHAIFPHGANARARSKAKRTCYHDFAPETRARILAQAKRLDDEW